MILDVSHPSPEQVTALMEEWAKDAKMDKLEPSQELKKIGSLHAKYLNILSTHRRALRLCDEKFAKLKRVKHEYYTGRLDAAYLKEQNWTPFPFTLKGDLATYMESDAHILHAKKVMSVHEDMIDLCERILKEIGSRTFQLRDIIQWERFISGVH